LVDIIYSYVYVILFFNGDLESDTNYCLDCFDQLSSVFRENVVHSSVGNAIQSVIQNSTHHMVLNTISFSVQMLEEVSEIYQSKENILRSLSHLYFYMEREYEDKKGKELFKMKKKLFFYIVWGNEILNDSSILLYKTSIDTEKQTQLSYLKKRIDNKDQQKPLPPKPLITEIKKDEQ